MLGAIIFWIIVGGIAGWLLSTYGGRFSHWSYQLAIIYIPIIVYGVMVLPQKFPRTENAEVIMQSKGAGISYWKIKEEDGNWVELVTPGTSLE